MFDLSYPKTKTGFYWGCAYCHTPDPEINGEVENHKEWCQFRHHVAIKQRLTEIQETLDDYKYVLKQIIYSLPNKRDWLDPDIEQFAKDLIKEN